MSTKIESSVSSAIKFEDINADEKPEITEVESLCMNCESQGKTIIFLTKIPYFKEVIVMSFSCDECGYRSNELQPGGKIQDLGVHYSVLINSAQDLNRQVIQADTASIKIPELEFEIPAGKGAITNVEGIITRAVSGLSQQQPLRRIQQPEVAEQIDTFIENLNDLLKGEKPFKFILDDPSGNSFVENPHAPKKDENMTVNHYKRSPEQCEALGIQPEADDRTVVASAGIPADKTLDLENEVIAFSINCPSCNIPCETRMKLVNIPHFKDVIIMATSCELCDYKDNEVKSGGAIEDKGCRIDLHIKDTIDLSRDVLKSETSSVSIPELDFETQMGTLGGKFTTIEGLLNDIISALKTENPFCFGDTAQDSSKKNLENFCEKINEIIEGKRLDIHFILDDSAGNSYIQDLCFPEEDPNLKITHYERNFQQNDELGINDMKTENYEAS